MLLTSQLEWICHALPMMEFTQSIDPAILTTDLNEHDVLVEFSQAMQLVASPYPLLKLMAYCQEPHDASFVLAPEPCRLLIAKTKDGCLFNELTKAEYQFLHYLLQEVPLAAALQDILKQDHLFQLVDLLIKCAQIGAINKIHILYKKS